MAGFIRGTIHSLAAKLAPRDDTTQHSLELTAKSTDVVAALEHYCSAYQSFAAASRELYGSIGSFYPPHGPLRPTLEALSKNGGGSPFSEDVVASRVEAMRQLEPVVAGLGALTKRIADTITQRNVLAQEKSHYIEKVGQLQATYNSAKPALRDAAREKLAENQAKLRKVLDEHAAAARSADEWTRSLDSDMANVLTPMVLSVIRTQAALHTDSAAFSTSAIALAGSREAPPQQQQQQQQQQQPPAATKPLPEGVAALLAPPLPDDHRSAATAAAAAVAALPPAPRQTESAAEDVSGGPEPTTAAAAAAPAPLSRIKPFVAVADADWEGQAEGDLAILSGALVLVFGVDSEGWWDARVSDESGLVPSNFCSVPAEPPPAAGGRMVAVDDYAPDDPSELAFRKGDVLEILTPRAGAPAASSPAARAVLESGWLLARTAAGVPGFVPSTYLEPLT